MNTEAKIALCRLVGVLLLTDGHLTDKEHDHFYGLMESMGLNESQRSEVTGGIQIDADLEPDVTIVKKAGGGSQLLEALEAAGSADGDMSEPERDAIARVKQILDA